MAYKIDPRAQMLSERIHSGDVSRRDFLKIAGSLFGAATAASLLAACGAAPQPAAEAPAEERVRLGFMTTISGIGSIHAPPTINAAQLAIDEINAAGGVLGRQVDLLIEDNNTNVPFQL